MKNKKTWILCFGTKWYSSAEYTEKHLIRRFHRDQYGILWIDPIPNRNLTQERAGSRLEFRKKILKRINYQLRVIVKQDKSFFVFRPFFLPTVETQQHFNLVLLKWQLFILITILRIKRFAVFSSRLENIPALFPRKTYVKFIQISGDLYSDLRGISTSFKNALVAKEFLVFSQADIILAASQQIRDKICALKIPQPSKVLYFPHGVDHAHFDTDQRDNTLLELKDRLQRPIAGFFGSLTHAVDQSVIAKLADNDFLVVLIGPILSDFSNLKNHPFVKFIGAVPYALLPPFANTFDVCIMAWKPAEWINNCNPSKTYEYLALGKPIVSCVIPELVDNLSDVIRFASTPDEFVKQCRAAIADDSADRSKLRKRMAHQMDWEQKYLQVHRWLNGEEW
jgi:glycosyltransferase involved in cell wall biosynthesis